MLKSHYSPRASLSLFADVSEILRITVSTRKNTPNPYWVLQILGEDTVKTRIEKVIKKLEK